jgi:hypothetical protein
MKKGLVVKVLAVSGLVGLLYVTGSNANLLAEKDYTAMLVCPIVAQDSPLADYSEPALVNGVFLKDVQVVDSGYQANINLHGNFLDDKAGGSLSNPYDLMGNCDPLIMHTYSNDTQALQILLGDLPNSVAGSFYPDGNNDNKEELIVDGWEIAPGLPVLLADENGNFFSEDGSKLIAQQVRLLYVINTGGKYAQKYNGVAVLTEDQKVEFVSISDWQKRGGIVIAVQKPAQNGDGTSEEPVIVTSVKTSFWGPRYVHYITTSGEEKAVKSNKFLQMLGPNGCALLGPVI